MSLTSTFPARAAALIVSPAIVSMAVIGSVRRTDPRRPTIGGEVTENRSAAPHVIPTSADTSQRNIAGAPAGTREVMAPLAGR